MTKNYKKKIKIKCKLLQHPCPEYYVIIITTLKEKTNLHLRDEKQHLMHLWSNLKMNVTFSR